MSEYDKINVLANWSGQLTYVFSNKSETAIDIVLLRSVLKTVICTQHMFLYTPSFDAK